MRLLRRHWRLARLEQFCDPQDRDLGIDLLEVSGRPSLLAVHCDLREMRDPPDIGWLRSAVERAASLGFPLGRFVVATTAWRSKALTRAVFEINRAQRAANRFAVEVFCWEDIEELLDQYPEALAGFEATPKRQALTRADVRCRFEPRWPALLTAADGSADRLAVELAEAAALLERRHYQMARLKMMQLREQRWSELSPDQRLGVLTGLAYAWLKEGELRKAAMLFIAARSLKPEEELACTNEVLAYELLGERERAFTLAEELRTRFPASGRAYALWLNNLPPSVTAAELEPRIAPELSSDPEVGMIMARRATGTGDYTRAERFARKSSETLSQKSDPWLILGQAILLGEIENASGPPAEERVREAEACFTNAIALASEEGSVVNEVGALIGRAQARIALHDIESAGEDIEKAHALEREDPNGLCEYGTLLRSRGNLDHAVEVFRRAMRLGGRDDAEYQLALTLHERDLPGDLTEAAGLLLETLASPQTIPGGDYVSAVACAVDTLSRLERWQEAESLLSGLSPGRIPETTTFTFMAALEMSRGNRTESSQLADRALGVMRPDAGADERRRLAALLQELGRYAEALTLWQPLVQAGFAPGDTRRLLECASRLGRDEIVLEVCRKLRADGVLVEGALDFELEILERTDRQGALRLLNEHVAIHPDDRVMRLRRSAVARGLGRAELVDGEPGAMPPAREVLPQLGRVAAQVMRETGHPNEALAYAYELLRRNPADPEAHRTFLYALGPLGPMPVVPEFETAQPGCALCFVEQDGSAEHWVILEDALEADEGADEYGPTHLLTKQLRGRRPGDKFQLPEARYGRKTGIVKRIVSKYAYRYQDCLAGWEKRFAGLPEIEMAASRVDTVRSSTEPEEFDGFGAPEVLTEGTLEKAEKDYMEHLLPVHAVAERLGISDLHAMFVLASRPGALIKCCAGSEDELNAALTAHNRASSIVLDLTAVATLCLLGRLNLLKTWPRQFVVAQATLHELRRLQFDNVLVRLPSGFSAALNGTAGQRPEAQLCALADEIQSTCEVGDGSGLTTLAPERRERLVRLFGRHGAESIALAAMPGHALWSDDGAIADLARSEFGVRRVWSQSAFMARAQAGNLDPAELATAGTKLAGWGYSFTTPGIEILMRAGSVAVWNPDQFPLRQALDQFATEAVKLSDAVILAAELIVKMYTDVYLRSTRTAVTLRLLDRLSERSGGREAIEVLPRSLPIRFGLDLIGARELADAIRGWMAEHANEMAA